MAEVKFTIKRYNGTTFDIALPKTVVEQVIEINEHLKDGDRHISAEDREVLKTVATLSAKGYAPIRNSAMATVKEYPTYTALKNDLANLPQGTTAMVLDASDDVLVDYGYAMYRVMLDETDNKTLIKVSDTMSMDFVLKLDNVRGFNQSAEAVDKMVEDSHFHDNFALLNTLTQGMFEGLKDYQKAKTTFENTLDKVGLRSGDMAFVKVGNDPTIPTEEEHTPGPVVPPVPSEEQPVHNEEAHTEQPVAPVTPGENTVTPQPEGTGENHTEQPVVPATPEETHENTESPAVTPGDNTGTPQPEAPVNTGDTHTEQPAAPVAEEPGHTEEDPVVTPEVGNPDTTGQPTTEEHQPQPPVAEDTHTEVTPANPTAGTEEKHEDAPVAEDTHTGENTASPVVPEAPKPADETNHTVEPSAPVENTEAPVVTPESGTPENNVTPQPEGTGETHTETEPVAPAPVEETHAPEENKPVAEETPASPEPNAPQPTVSEDNNTESPVTTGETQPVNPPDETHTETSNPEEHKEEGVATEHPVANEGQPATPVPSEETPGVTPENGTPDSAEHVESPVVTPEENKPVTPQPEAEVNPHASEDTHTEEPTAPVAEDTHAEVTPANPAVGTEEKHEDAPVNEGTHTEQPAAPVAEEPAHTEENVVAPAVPEEPHENTESPTVTPESGTPENTVTPQPEGTGETHTEQPVVNTGESHSEESSSTPAVGTEENNVATPVADEPAHTEVTPAPTPAVPEEHAHSETTENSEGTPVVNTEDTSGDTPKPATPDDERFNSHLAVQPKPVENDLPEGVSPTSGNN